MSNKPASNSIEVLIKSHIRDIADYPKPGIMFRDITPLLKDANAFNEVIDELSKKVSLLDFDYIAGMEARGFIIGSVLAYKLGKGFIPIRKKGKLPFETIHADYDLEYGVATLEVHKDAAKKGNKVLIVDDLLATGGTAGAASKLVNALGAKVAGYVFIIELSGLNGRSKLKDADIIALAKY